MPVLERDDLANRLLLATEVGDAVRLTLAYTFEVSDLAAQVGRVVRSVYSDLAHTDRADISSFITEAEPYVRAGIGDASDLAAAYVSEMTGSTVTTAQIDAAEIALEWEGPFQRTWHQLGEGDLYLEAKESGSSVAEALGHDATIDGASKRLGRARRELGIRGYRRVVTAKACEWCRVVATQFYRSEATATFGHHGCKCIVVPVFEAQHDTAQSINKARLSDLKQTGAVSKASEARVRSKARERAHRAAAMAAR